MDFREDQIVIFEPSDPRWSVQELTVTKVGRKWVYVTGLGADRKWAYVAGIGAGSRFDKTTLWVDGAGYASPGRIWLSREDLEQEKERLALRDLLKKMANDWSAQYTLGQLQEAVAALRGEDE